MPAALPYLREFQFLLSLKKVDSISKHIPKHIQTFALIIISVNFFLINPNQTIHIHTSRNS